MSQNPQEKQQAKLLTWEEVLKYPRHKKAEFLTNQYPKSYEYAARKLIENSGVENHDLLFYHIFIDALKCKQQGSVLSNTEKLHKKIEEQAMKLDELDQKVDANHELILQELSAIKLNVDLGMESANRLVKGVAARSKNRKKKTRKQIWWEWIKSPPGIMSSVIAALMLIAVLMLMILIFK